MMEGSNPSAFLKFLGFCTCMAEPDAPRRGPNRRALRGEVQDELPLLRYFTVAEQNSQASRLLLPLLPLK